MLIPSIYLLAGIALLYFGGECLVRGSVSLAYRAGVPPLVAGLTIVAFGTSAPELAVTLQAGLDGYGGVALGNVVGSNICNVGLILGTAAFLAPFRVDPQLFRVDMPIMVVCTVLLAWMLGDGGLSRSEGALLASGIVGYIGLHLWILSQRARVPESVESVRQEHADSPLPLDIALVVGGLVALAAGGHCVVRGGVDLASAFGVSDAVIALTVIAVGTSLPELVVCLIAAAKAHGDVAIGNVVGSTIFNTFAILGITGAVVPLDAAGLVRPDLIVMMAAAVSVPLLAWPGRRLGRVEGVLLLLGYVLFTAARVATI